LFVEAYHRVFAILFWYMVLGPMGAVMYRVVDLCKTRGTYAVSEAAAFQTALDWLPVRVFTFVFALGGHFTNVIAKWKTQVLSKSDVNNVLLTECGIAALDVLEAERIPEDGTAEKETLALLDRVFVMTLVLLAFVVLLV
jgi:Membrane protein required for beta-lactamase induction